MDMRFFAESAAEICRHSLVAQGRPVRWVIIANPMAGGFAIKRRWKRHTQALQESCEKARANPLRETSCPAAAAREFGAPPELAACGLVPTTGPGMVRKIAQALIDEAGAALTKNKKKFGGSDGALGGFSGDIPFYLLITAGGDGTSLEALSVLYYESDEIRKNMAVLRLPMGTGNDGAEAPDLAAALDRLIQPSRLEFSPALRLLTASGGGAEEKGPFLAFNILSIGLDAFVTHMSNKMKEKLPGDSYKLWVDIAALFYDRIYTVDYLDVRALDGQGNEVCAFREKALLLAMGVTGHRSYGSQKKILPDDRNVCVVKQMSLLRKLALKGLFTTGEHVNSPESMLCTARRIEFSGRHPLLAQTDGETVLLQQDDFPAAIEITAPVIPVLQYAGN